METLMEAWVLVLLASVFVFPHLLGILLYYRLSWAPGWLARTVAALSPAVIFFWLASMIFLAGFRDTPASEVTCGNAAAFIGIFVLFTTVVQLVLGVFTHVVLVAFRK